MTFGANFFLHHIITPVDTIYAWIMRIIVTYACLLLTSENILFLYAKVVLEFYRDFYASKRLVIEH